MATMTISTSSSSQNTSTKLLLNLPPPIITTTPMASSSSTYKTIQIRMKEMQGSIDIEINPEKINSVQDLVTAFHHTVFSKS